MSGTPVANAARMLRPSFIAIAVTLLCACADVPEHEVAVVLDYDGAHFEGVLRFADHDDEFSGGDDSCSFLSGNCGQRSTTTADVVSGALPLERAVLEGDGDFYTYDVWLRPSASDQAAIDAIIAKDPYRPFPRFGCKVYSSSLGKPAECSGSTKSVSMVATPRD